MCAFVRYGVAQAPKSFLQVMLQIEACMVAANEDVHDALWLNVKDTLAGPPVRIERSDRWIRRISVDNRG